MKLTGHKTEAVHRRYAIVAEQDLEEGVAKLSALRGGAPAQACTGTNGGTNQAGGARGSDGHPLKSPRTTGRSEGPGAESNCPHAGFHSAALPTKPPCRGMQ